MKSFAHVNARTVSEAIKLLRRYEGRARLNAGGTDLLGILKDRILLDYPDAVINIKTISGLDYIREDSKELKIGALTSLSDIAKSPGVRERYDMLAEAARAVATPQIRNMATLGGNLCQDVRCWYYRYPDEIGGRILCLRKGRGRCLAVAGDNRYHAILGGEKCFAVCPSDTAIALTALGAKVKITGSDGNKMVLLDEFFQTLGNILRPDEMITEVRIPGPPIQAKQTFLKFTLRKPVDLAVVSVASMISMKKGVCTDARIVLGAVAPTPIRAVGAEKAIIGKVIDARTAFEAAEAAVSGAKPLSLNAYKVEIAKTLVRQALQGTTSATP